MKQCPDCGAQNTTGARDCVACGSKRLVTDPGAVYERPNEPTPPKWAVYEPLSEPASPKWMGSWYQFADQVGGEFVSEGRVLLGVIPWGKRHRVRTKVDQWVVTLEPIGGGADDPRRTRMSTPYSSLQPLSFAAFRPNKAQSLTQRFLRLQDIEVGHQEFDESFIIKGSDEAKTRNLFASSELRSHLQSRQDLHFRSDGKMLDFVTDGWVTDIELLTAVHDLFVVALRELQRLGLIR